MCAELRCRWVPGPGSGEGRGVAPLPCGAAPRQFGGQGRRLGGKAGISGWPGRVSINPRVWLPVGFMPEQSHC